MPCNLRLRSARWLRQGTSVGLDCGCGELHENHGDARHITMDTIRAAAQASEISVDEAMKNIADGVRPAQQTSGKTGSAPDVTG